MIHVLGALGYLITGLAILCTFVLLASGMKRLREGCVIPRLLEGTQWVLILATCLAWIIGIGAIAWKGSLDRQSWLALDQGPNGELAQKATRRCLQKELKGSAAESAGQARTYFDAGDDDLTAMRYREAAEDYERSVRALPTASGYLNLGLALIYLSEFRRGEEAFSPGIQIAQQREDHRMEGAYLDGIGRAYRGQGRLEAALSFHRAALQMHTQVGNPLGRANAHTNIGDVYLAQGKMREALISHREAFALYTRLGNLLGRANALDHIGIVYSRLGEQDEALRALQEALSLDTRIGNLLGQRRDLDDIAGIYSATGKRQEALEMLRQSREMLQRMKVGPRNAQDPERMTDRTNAARAEETPWNLDGAAPRV